MKLGFQGWYLSQPYAGIGVHSLGLLRSLAATKKVALTVVTPKPVRISGLTVHVLPTKTWLLHPALKKWYWERIQVPAFFGRRSLDWEYYPYPCPLPSASAHFRAMTVHDLILWDDPRYKGGRIKQAYHRHAKRALIHVDHLFTVSKTTHDELGIPAATLLPNGLPELPTGLKKMPCGKDLVYLGGYDIRKQVPQLIRQFIQTLKENPNRRLLLVGKPHHHSRYYPVLPQHPSVKTLGALSDKQLYSLLKSAFAFVHYSDAEGFNIPLIQALAAGTPAIVRDLPINREVAHGAALFINPSQMGELSASLKTLTQPKKRSALIAKGKKVAGQYSWEKTAKLFLKALT